MVYLITGGAGFIGSHLAERLLDRGDQVLLMDNLSTGSMENIRHLKKYDRMHYFLEPLENRQLLAELVDEADVIFHLAAAVGVKLIVESPVRTIETNVNGTQMVLEAACRKRKLVFTASTSEVYGKSIPRAGDPEPPREGREVRWSALAAWSARPGPRARARGAPARGAPEDPAAARGDDGRPRASARGARARRRDVRVRPGRHGSDRGRCAHGPAAVLRCRSSSGGSTSCSCSS